MKVFLSNQTFYLYFSKEINDWWVIGEGGGCGGNDDLHECPKEYLTWF